MIASHRIHVLNSPGPAEKQLIWDVFFESRGRGRSLEFHAPWLDRDSALRVVCASIEDRLAGLAILKPCLALGKPGVAMVGFVCVDPQHRGAGMAADIMRAIRQEAESLGLDGIVLWTGTPAVYARQGYEPDPIDVLVQFQGLAGSEVQARHSVPVLPDGPLGVRGFPAFAQGAWMLESDSARALMLETSIGPALAEWEGQDDAVAALLAHSLAEPFWINALASDSLPRVLEVMLGSPVDERPSSRLVLRLKPGMTAPFPGIRMLDRI